ncbi:DUF5694 domain-containing protein [Qipengyuania sp. SS22]|uniref:DUF5694 domain-containing protein n=1 Tax=Qipengyuania sp. SS22 TaxID=2979461 RepID=UPI0021E5BF95|nr:DUF5694 domain-containing protein [Qipengyuania sp. SS22]UYH55259.1 DUF5694 domain-containing protein [Qipengyuania sp. SS22]
MSIFLAALLAATTPSAPIASEANDPVSTVDQAARDRGELSEVLVLGSAHLSSLPENFDTKRLNPLLDRLEGWQPDAIAIESLDGPQCDFLRAYEHAYDGTAETYCPDPTPAREALGIGAAQAHREIGELLAEAAPDRPASQRRQLGALFLAMSDPNSALVQWLRLPEAERHAGGALSDQLVQTLAKRMARMSESSLIAARLAARLGHERVYPVDDHTGDIAGQPIDEESFGKHLRQIWDNPATAKRLAAYQEWQNELEDGTLSVLEWYRRHNADEPARLAMAGDFGAAAGSTLPGNNGRKYLAYWETRNLRMVANLRQVIGDERRVLAIVGVSHKPYYERYLRMTSDVVVVDTDVVLKAD